MPIVSAVTTAPSTPLTAEQILRRMPNSSADELQGIYRDLNTAYQALRRFENGQVIRLLDKEAAKALKPTLDLLKQILLPLESTIVPRREQEAQQHNNQQAIESVLRKAFPALVQSSESKPSCEALLQAARWLLIAESDLYFSWLVPPSGHQDFFEQEPPRLLRFLTRYVVEATEDHPDTAEKPAIEVVIKQLKKTLSRPLNTTETALFKKIQEELAVELSNNVVRLKPNGTSVKQGEMQ